MDIRNTITHEIIKTIEAAYNQFIQLFIGGITFIVNEQTNRVHAVVIKAHPSFKHILLRLICRIYFDENNSYWTVRKTLAASVPKMTPFSPNGFISINAITILIIASNAAPLFVSSYLPAACTKRTYGCRIQYEASVIVASIAKLRIVYLISVTSAVYKRIKGNIRIPMQLKITQTKQ